MIIDGHSHVILPVQKHIELMNQAGVDKTILFSTSIHPETAGNFVELKAEMKRLNQMIGGTASAVIAARRAATKEQADSIQVWPERFIGFGAVPLSLTDDNQLNDYIKTEVIANGFVGLGEFTLPSGAVSLLEPIFRSAANWGNLPVWIHAFNPLTLDDIRKIRQLAAKFTHIPVIVGHLGGSNWLETIEFVKETPNLYLDISAYFSTLVLKMAIHQLPDKSIWGVDMPYGDLELSMAAVKKVTKDAGICKAVLGENMAALLKL